VPTFRNTVCSISIPIRLWRLNRQSVPKRRHIKFRLRGITRKKAYKTKIMYAMYPSCRHIIFIVVCCPWWFSYFFFFPLIQQPAGPSHLILEIFRTYTYTHKHSRAHTVEHFWKTRCHLHKTKNERDEYPCSQLDSNPLSPQSSIRRRKPNGHRDWLFF